MKTFNYYKVTAMQDIRLRYAGKHGTVTAQRYTALGKYDRGITGQMFERLFPN